MRDAGELLHPVVTVQTLVDTTAAVTAAGLKDEDASQSDATAAHREHILLGGCTGASSTSNSTSPTHSPPASTSYSARAVHSATRSVF